MSIPKCYAWEGINPLVPGRKSSSMFTGGQPASYCTQLANFHFEGGYKHNVRPKIRTIKQESDLCRMFTPCFLKGHPDLMG